MTLGLDGSPMPSFADSMSEEERWAISYYVLSLSAWRDPLTGELLNLPAAARAALDSPDVAADQPRFALDPTRPEPVATERARPRTLYPGIRE
jgi:cytochrome c oxidase cbb3-type subunit 2